MARLQIIESEQNVRESRTPTTTALNLPLSLATQQGAAINSVVKAIGDIQNDLVKIETQNKVDKIKPNIVKDIFNTYKVASKEDSTDAALAKFYQLTDPKSFEFYFQNEKPLVKKLLRNEILKERDGLVTKLFNKVTTNQVNAFTVNLQDKFNKSIKRLLSNDQYEIGIGEAEIRSLSNNKFYEQQLGAKNYKKIVDDALKLKNNLLLDLDTKIDPKGVIEGELALAEALGTDAAKDLVQKARVTLRDNRNKTERDERIFELADAETKVGVFTNVLLRIDNFLKNPTDNDAVAEMPTEAELYDLLDKGLINEAMFGKLSVAMTDEDGFSDDETLAFITTQLASVNTIEAMDELEKSYITDVDTLKALNNRDLSLFSAYIAKAKTDFASHKDFKQYSKLIDSNIANLSNVRTSKGAKFAQNLATRKQLIQMNFYNRVNNGMSPKDAYLDTLQNDFQFEAIPNLNNIPVPYFMQGTEYFKALSEDINFFTRQNEKAAEIFNKSNKNHRDLQEYIRSLAQLDFVEDIFNIRMTLTNNDLKQATETGIVGTLELPEGGL